jgi:hypothetical protein
MTNLQNGLRLSAVATALMAVSSQEHYRLGAANNANTHQRQSLRGLMALPTDPKTTELKLDKHEVQHMHQVMAEAMVGAFFDMGEDYVVSSHDPQHTPQHVEDDGCQHASTQQDQPSSQAMAHLNFRGHRLAQNYEQYFHAMQVMASHKLVTSELELFMGDATMFTTLPEGDLIFWNSSPSPDHEDDGNVVMQLSAFNSMLVMDGRDDKTRGDYTWQYVDPHHVGLLSENDNVQTITLEEHRQEYVALPLWGNGVNFWSDYFGMIAFLRQKLPFTTKLILMDDTEGSNKRQLEALDPEFANTRVVWIACQQSSSCNQHIRVRGGGTLTLVKPPVSLRHLSLFRHAREWIQERTTNPETQLQASAPDANANVVYYMQPLLSEEENAIAIFLIQPYISKHIPNHNIVALAPHNTNMPLQDEMKLLSTASMVIGAASAASGQGGFAPLFLSTPEMAASGSMSENDSAPCPNAPETTSRPKVLEFLMMKNQHNKKGPSSLYEEYSTMPWAEYHYLALTPSRDGKFDGGTPPAIDFRDLDQALLSLFAP